MQQVAVLASQIRRTTRTIGLRLPGDQAWELGLVVAFLLWLAWSSIASGAPGDLDPTFGTGGIAITFGPNDSANALVMQADSKFVVAGTSMGDGSNNILLARYWPTGDVDSAFGRGGKVTVRFGSGSTASTVVVQPDGKLVVAGSAVPAFGMSSDVLLARFLPDGSLDLSFGEMGSTTSHFVPNNIERATALLLQPDGKFVVAGISSLVGAPISYAILARYLPDGSLDSSFGVEGSRTLMFERGSGINALIQQPDGKLVVAGFGGLSRVTPSFLVLARFQSDGSVDTAFGEGGKVTLPAPSQGVGLNLQPDGKLVVAGLAVPPSGVIDDLLLARFLPDGSLDAAFGAGGVVIADLGDQEFPRALVQQPDGKLVVTGGLFGTSGAADVFLARYLSDGSPDAGFGAGGIVITDIGERAFAGALLQQSDGKLVVAGSFATSNEGDIFLARYQTLGCPRAAPESCLAQLEAFVTDVYLAAYERMPDAGEIGYWMEVLDSQPTPDTARAMLQLVFASPEFRHRSLNPWQYVHALYLAVLGREPAPADLDWWVTAYLERVNTALPLIITSAEFQRLVPDCQDQATVTILVGRLYQQVLGRVASAAELAWWSQNISVWCDLVDAVEVFFNSGEYLGDPRTLADHVTLIYRALLAREPDAGGLAGWVGYLAGQLTALEDEFMRSVEFEVRFRRLFP